ncbi:MAG TPA: glycosyltransferase, partial [Aquella sp.]|nr:glycosyltransferase [Aquella sp.]
MEDIKIVASIVLYKNNPKILITTINSFLNSTLGSQLYLIDNSPTNELKSLAEIEKRIVYIHNPSNPGFGAAHNIAIKKAIKLNAIYHFVINPDVYFDVDVITSMVNYMSNDASIGMLMPEVLNADGSIQNLPKLLPSP